MNTIYFNDDDYELTDEGKDALLEFFDLDPETIITDYYFNYRWYNNEESEPISTNSSLTATNLNNKDLTDSVTYRLVAELTQIVYENANGYGYKDLSDVDSELLEGVDLTLEYQYTVSYDGPTQEDADADEDHTLIKAYFNNLDDTDAWTYDASQSGNIRTIQPVTSKYYGVNPTFSYSIKCYSKKGDEILIGESEDFVSRYDWDYPDVYLFEDFTPDDDDNSLEQVDYYEITYNQIKYGAVLFGPVSVKVPVKYNPIHIYNTEIPFTERIGGKHTFDAQKNPNSYYDNISWDEDICAAPKYQWYTRKGNVDTKLDGETARTLVTKITDTETQYVCEVIPQYKTDDHPVVSDIDPIVFTYNPNSSASAGYLVYEGIPSYPISCFEGESVELKIDAVVDSGFKLSYEWKTFDYATDKDGKAEFYKNEDGDVYTDRYDNKYFYMTTDDETLFINENGDLYNPNLNGWSPNNIATEPKHYNKKLKSDTSTCEVTPVVPAGCRQRYCLTVTITDSNDNLVESKDYDCLITVNKEPEATSGYTCETNGYSTNKAQYWDDNNTLQWNLKPDFNNGTTFVPLRGDDVELYAIPEVNTEGGFAVTQKWYESKDVTYKSVSTGWDYGNSDYIWSEPLPEDSSFDETEYESYNIARTYRDYDSNNDYCKYEVRTYYREITLDENAKKGTCLLKGKDANGDAIDTRGKYASVIQVTKAAEGEGDPEIVAAYNYSFAVDWDSELTCYAKNNNVTAEFGGNAVLEVVAHNINSTVYPITYTWTKTDPATGKTETIKDKDGKNLNSPRLELKNLKENGFGAYKVTVSDTLQEWSDTIMVTSDSVNFVSYTPGTSTYRAKMDEKVTMAVDFSVSEDIEVIYKWSKYIDYNNGYWEEINEDADDADYTIQIKDDRDFTTYQCELTFKNINNNTVYNDKRTFQFNIIKQYDAQLENLTPATQIRKPGDSVTHTVRLLTNNNTDIDTSALTYVWEKWDLQMGAYVEIEEGDSVKVTTNTTNQTSSLTITGLKNKDITSYQCTVYSGETYIASYIFTMQKCGNISLKNSSTNIEVAIGSDVTLSPEFVNDSGEDCTDADVEKEGFSYQWYRCAAYSYSGNIIHNATERSYTVENVGVNDLYDNYDGCYYYCIISQDEAYIGRYTVYLSEESADDAIWSVEVKDGCEISQSVPYGGRAEFAVEVIKENDAAEKLTYKYQWYKDGTAIMGATNATYTIEHVAMPDCNSYYSCTVTASNGTSASYNSFHLTSTTGVEADDKTIGYKVAIGDNKTLHQTAVDNGEYKAFYQWFKDDADKGYVKLYGETKATLTLSNIQYEDLGDYYCEVSDSKGVITRVRHVVYTDAGLVVEPSSYLPIAAADGSVKMYVTAKVDSGYTLAYNWYKYDEEGEEITLSETASCVISKITKADYGDYYCEVSAMKGTTVVDRAKYSYNLMPMYEYTVDKEWVQKDDEVKLSANIINPATDVDYVYTWTRENDITDETENVADGKTVAVKVPELKWDNNTNGYMDLDYTCTITDSEDANWDRDDVSVQVLPPNINYVTQYPETSHPYDKRYDIQAYRIQGASRLTVTLDGNTEFANARFHVISRDGHEVDIMDVNNIGVYNKTFNVPGDTVIFLVSGSDRDVYGYKVTSIVDPDAKIPGVPSIPGTPSAPGAPGTSVSPETSVSTGTTSAGSGSPAEGGEGLPAKNAVVSIGNVSYVVSNPDAKNGEVKVKAIDSKKKKSITKVVIPDTVKINGYTFKVVEVSKNAFKGCAKLKTLVVGKNVKTIGANAFSGDKKLKKITIKGTAVKKVGKNAFKSVPKSAKMKVPSKSKAAYKKLFKKGGYKGKVK